MIGDDIDNPALYRARVTMAVLVYKGHGRLIKHFEVLIIAGAILRSVNVWLDFQITQKMPWWPKPLESNKTPNDGSHYTRKCARYTFKQYALNEHRQCNTAYSTPIDT